MSRGGNKGARTWRLSSEVATRRLTAAVRYGHTRVLPRGDLAVLPCPYTGTEIGGCYVSSTLLHPCAPSTFTTGTLGTRLVLLAPDGGGGGGLDVAAAASGSPVADLGGCDLIHRSLGLLWQWRWPRGWGWRRQRAEAVMTRGLGPLDVIVVHTLRFASVCASVLGDCAFERPLSMSRARSSPELWPALPVRLAPANPHPWRP